MGSVFMAASRTNDTTKNIAVGDIYQILIPQEFGGGFIRYDIPSDYVGKDICIQCAR